MRVIWKKPARSNNRRWIVALSRLPDGAARELAADPDLYLLPIDSLLAK